MKKYYDIIKKVIEEKNLIPKAASLLLAIILWFYVSKEKISDISIKLPIAFNGLENNYVVSDISTKVITAKISGNKDEINNISSNNIKLVVDLSAAEVGDYKTYPIEYHNIDFAGNYNIALDPENVKILIEKKITRRVKVIPEFKGTTRDGFMLGQVKFFPEYVTIDGPSSIINNIGIIHTENIAIDGKNETFNRNIKIRKVYEDNVNYSISRMNITVPIINYSETEIIELPVLLRNKKRGFNYLLIFDKVKIQILKKDEEYIAAHSLSAYIDCDEINFDNEEFVSKSKITAIGFIYVIADTLKTESRILSSMPVTSEIVVTKE